MVFPVDNPRADPDRDIFSNAFPHPLKIFQRRRYAAGGAPRGAPRAHNARLVEKNGFEPGFEPRKRPLFFCIFPEKNMYNSLDIYY